MAKKPLTPEQAEIKAMKKAKKSENWTKFWAILLAAVLTFAVVSMGKTAAEDAIEKAKEQNQTESVDSNNTTNNNNTTTTPGGDTTTPGGDTTTPGGDTTTPGGSTSTPGASTDDAKKTVADAVNAATAKAAKGSYEMERVCDYQEGKGINVTMFGGDATETLNGVIKAVDENADLGSVVGGFLGIGTKKIKVTNGVGKRYGSDGTMADLSAEEKDYLLKATNLSASDLASASVNGNVYTFTIANLSNPQKDGKNSMHKATNDFITETQVKTAIGNLTDAITVESVTASYYDITFTATIENGNLKQLDMNYKADAVMKLKVLVAIDGNGSIEVNTTYKF